MMSASTDTPTVLRVERPYLRAGDLRVGDLFLAGDAGPYRVTALDLVLVGERVGTTGPDREVVVLGRQRPVWLVVPNGQDEAW
jgi:hypothetical protein